MTHDPYKIWVSEIFLQQTQADRVKAFYTKMITAFPSIESFAESNWEEFFPYFKGLGFYSRGKNMLRTAEKIVQEHHGKFPCDADLLQTLPGIGFYTAHAILSFAYGKNVPALDTNLYRVLSRVWGKEEKGAEKEIQNIAFQVFKNTDGVSLNHALMDLGSSFCTAKKAECSLCPLSKICTFSLENKTVCVSTKKARKKTKGLQNYSCMVLRFQGKYLLQYKSSGKWGFPIFWRNTSEYNDHRHFLKHMSQKKWGMEISVRPPFWEEEVFFSEKNDFDKPSRIQFSRCQILSGENALSSATERSTALSSERFFSPSEIKTLCMEEVYSSEFLEKLLSMRA